MSTEAREEVTDEPESQQPGHQEHHPRDQGDGTAVGDPLRACRATVRRSPERPDRPPAGRRWPSRRRRRAGVSSRTGRRRGREDDGVETGHDRRLGDRGVTHALRDRHGRQRRAGDQVGRQPGPLVPPQCHGNQRVAGHGHETLLTRSPGPGHPRPRWTIVHDHSDARRAVGAQHVDPIPVVARARERCRRAGAMPDPSRPTADRRRRTVSVMGPGDRPTGAVPPGSAASAAGAPGVATLSDVVDDGFSEQPGGVRRRSAGGAAQQVVPHPSAGERHARGRLARAETPRGRLGTWEPSADRPDPVALLVGQEASRVQELRPRAARPDGNEPLHLLPRGGAGDGRGPGDDAPHHADGAAVRRRAPVQLRSVRRAGPLRRLRRQRLRRDQPRTVRVGRQAAGHLVRAGRTRQRAAAGCRASGGRGRRRLLPRVHGDLRHAGRARDLVRPGRRQRAGGRRLGAPRTARDKRAVEGGGARRRRRSRRRWRRPGCATPGRRSRRSPRSWTDAAASATSRRC